MTLDPIEWFDRMRAHDDLALVGIEDGKLMVRHGPTKAVWAVGPQAVVDEEWEALERVLTGKRDVEVLSHMTRIVGYYSQIENWNKSALGQLADRRKGNYEIPEA